ncbi:MAG: hypothetical protein PVJ76_17515 [Gemmatimonadota bacterium]|jgi:hypothetical protein
MTLGELLDTRAPAIIQRALEAMGRAHLAHYRALGPEETKTLVEALYDTTRRAVLTRTADALLDHADRIAEDRFTSGFDLFEVQIAFNALEEAIWREVLDRLPPDEQPEALGLISTGLGIGKDALARGFLARANKYRSPSVDLRALFQGL